MPCRTYRRAAQALTYFIVVAVVMYVLVRIGSKAAAGTQLSERVSTVCSIVC